LARQGHFTLAVAQFRAALARDPSRASAHSDLADALMSEVSGENLDQPMPASRHADPDREQRIGVAARAALAALREAQRLDPNLPAVLTRMGAIYDVLGQHDDALLAFQEAVRRDPADAEAHYTLGSMYLDRNDPARALPVLETASQLSPTALAIRLSLARCYLALDRRRDAERELDYVDELRPGMPQVAELRARVGHLKRP
jgi:Flp pilus assembly protein TadD